jgi:hypothetical protein
LSHASLRAASRQRGVARMSTERTRHTWHSELSRQCGACRHLRRALVFLAEQGVSRPIGEDIRGGSLTSVFSLETNSNRLEGLDGASGQRALCKRPYNLHVLATKRRSSCADHALGSQRHPNILALSLISQTVPLVHLCPSHPNILEMQDVFQCV